ncbi:DUF2190 family protein [Ancylobacter dichloromethanicus]|uniref:DUF2190 domain-containing protein n=1 Tax=Ancylobacter dichloromethanicus TaxID=518825 RepID=A0A9W6N1Z9_9HYPH|nr:DUF2190 family protein [Ancylobacter dichloromethanicus]MBS7556506.1 DUF2190 family protein [Ancylobacter dichloromethanicus]GLK74726.1 hypothetical protein GCM10017643_48450 [Ancylobacter dichloromethanicus]
MRPFIKSYIGAVAVDPYLIVKAAAPTTGTTVRPGAAATDVLLGVTDALGGDQGGTVDVVLAGPAEVRAGGNIAFGDPLTSDANGKAIKAVPVAGQTVVIVGWAGAPGALDDILPITVAKSLLPTPAA